MAKKANMVRVRDDLYAKLKHVADHGFPIRLSINKLANRTIELGLKNPLLTRLHTTTSEERENKYGSNLRVTRNRSPQNQGD
jgi:hypothetical protein